MMLKDPSGKYSPFATVDLPNRQWPSRVQRSAPIWCSVDLRDGNQSLIEPMNSERKLRFFKMLLSAGFKEIEVGFPSASQTDFDFVRTLIEDNLIPDDVTIQVLTQARSHLISRTFEALKGVKKAIVHIYNATAPLFRDVVFGVDKAGCIELAVEGVNNIRAEMEKYPDVEWTLEYSPELFSMTEPDFVVEICDAVMSAYGANADNKVIINLPATVENATPNVYADQIEYFCTHIKQRDAVIVSLHPHNDRGTGVAAAELGMLAGADRIEGTLFGNGERTGNVDIITLALNLYVVGVDPQLDFSDIIAIKREVEHCNNIPVHPRHPYGGELVFTAFSGSHQDAIKKGFSRRKQNPEDTWQIPYLPIDPMDLERSYEAVIRVNSQSGKGGVAWLLEREGISLPRRLQIEFSRVIQRIADQTGNEITLEMVLNAFNDEYLEEMVPYALLNPKLTTQGNQTQVEGTLGTQNGNWALQGMGNGPLDALVNALHQYGINIDIVDYHEHAASGGAGALAYAYVEIRADHKMLFGVGRDSSILNASMKALLSAVSRATRKGHIAPLKRLASNA